MEAAFADIIKMDNVLGGFIFSEAGNVEFQMVPDMYSPDMLEDVVEEYFRGMNSFHALDDGWDYSDVVLDFESGKLVVRKVGAYFVMLICSSDVNVTMLNVGLNVIAYKMKKMSINTTGDLTTAISQSRARYTTPGFSSGISIPDPPSTLTPSGSFSTTTMNSGISPLPPGTEVLSVSVVKMLTKHLAMFIGPVAKPIFKKAASSLGFKRSAIPKSKANELIDLLAAEIPKAEKRKQFITIARNLVMES